MSEVCTYCPYAGEIPEGVTPTEDCDFIFKGLCQVAIESIRVQSETAETTDYSQVNQEIKDTLRSLGTPTT